MNRIDPTLRDVYELNFLSNLQDQRAVLSRVRQQTKTGMEAIASGQNGMPQASTPATNASTATEDDQAIYNRSPTINHNYYRESSPSPDPVIIQPQLPNQPVRPAPTPITQTTNGVPIWVVALLITGLLLLPLLWYLFSRQPIASNPVTSTPVTPVAPIVVAPTPSSGSTEYLELR